MVREDVGGCVVGGERVEIVASLGGKENEWPEPLEASDEQCFDPQPKLITEAGSGDWSVGPRLVVAEGVAPGGKGENIEQDALFQSG